jgi:tetratricopeptide (TPR) repeat protein
VTPKQVFDTGGRPFACTRLDEFSGVEHQQDAYRMAEGDERVDRRPDSVFGNVKAKAEAGAQRMAEGEFGEAYELLVEAIGLLPEPKSRWNAMGWLLVALGENAIQAGNYEAAARPLQDAMWCPATIGNPWVHLRLGQVYFELDDEERATDELAPACMGEGREIFEGHDPKYFALVESVLEVPPGMNRLA